MSAEGKKSVSGENQCRVDGEMKLTLTCVEINNALRVRHTPTYRGNKDKGITYKHQGELGDLVMCHNYAVSKSELENSAKRPP